MRARRVVLHLTVAALTLVFAVSGRAEITNCTHIASLPATISTQGIYCLTSSLSTAITSGNAIEISANNVTLDLNGWKLGGQAAGVGTGALGINSVAINVTVRNGIVRGFMTGVHLEGRGARVEDLLVDQSTQYGIRVEGQGSLVRRNQVIDTGGSTVTSNVSTYGIYVDGPGSVIEDNIVSGLTATGDGDERAVYLGNAAHQSVVRRNVLSDVARPAGAGYSEAIGIDTSDVILVENNVTNFDVGIVYFTGATGTYAQNVVVNCTQPYYGGTLGSDND